MSVSAFKRIALIVGAGQLALVGCATPQRLPAVPLAQVSQAQESLGPIRFLVSRETDSFEAEARLSLAKEQQWLASHRGRMFVESSTTEVLRFVNVAIAAAGTR